MLGPCDWPLLTPIVGCLVLRWLRYNSLLTAVSGVSVLYEPVYCVVDVPAYECRSVTFGRYTVASPTVLLIVSPSASPACFTLEEIDALASIVLVPTFHRTFRTNPVTCVELSRSYSVIRPSLELLVKLPVECVYAVMFFGERTSVTCPSLFRTTSVAHTSGAGLDEVGSMSVTTLDSDCPTSSK